MIIIPVSNYSPLPQGYYFLNSQDHEATIRELYQNVYKNVCRILFYYFIFELLIHKKGSYIVL